MLIDYYSTLIQVRALAKSSNMALVLEDDCQPRTDGSTIYVQKPSPEWTKEEMIEWQMTVYHEIGHNTEGFKDCFTVAKEKDIDMSSLLGSLMNILDDHRQEHGNGGMYRGRDRVVEEGNYITLKRVLEVAKEKFGQSEDKSANLLEAMLAHDVSEREPWMPMLGGMGSAFAATLSDKGREYFDTLQDNAEDIDPKNKTAFEEYDIAIRILDMLDDFDSEEEKEKAKGKGKGEGEGGEKGKGEGETGEGKGEGEGELAKARERVLHHKHDGFEHKEEDEEAGRVVEMTYEKPTNSGAYMPSPVKVENVAKRTSTDKHFIEAVNHIDSNAAGMANTLRKLLQVISQAHYQHGLKSGKIGRNLHRVTMTGTGSYQQRVFKKKIENHVLDTAVTVLVDCSGSMSGDKYEHAAKSAVLINDSLATIGVPVEVLGFTETGYHDDITNVIYEFKTFDTAITDDKLVESFSKVRRSLHNNADGESILVAHQRLVARKNRRKIMIVLSDGAPACANESGNIWNFTKEVIRTIEEKSPVEIYGLGIMSNEVRSLYKEHSVVSNSADLEGKLLEVLKKKVIN